MCPLNNKFPSLFNTSKILSIQSSNNQANPMSSSQLTLDDIWQLFKETDRKFQETDLKFQETDRLFKETNKKIGDLGNRLGEFVQEMVRPAVVRLFRQRGIEVHQVMRNIEAFDDENAIEIDLLVINQQQAIAVECKSRLSIEDVDEHLARLDKFKPLFKYYQNIVLMGAVAGMVVPDDVAKYAYRRGLFVLAQNGDSILIRNDDKFNPRQW